jgi:hypothetical protein
MKIFSAIATAAVVGTSLTTLDPAEATVFVDIDSHREVLVNDGSDFIFVKKDGVTRLANEGSARKPVPSKNEKWFKSLPTISGTSGVKFKKSNVTMGSSEMIQAGINIEGLFYIIKDLGGSDNARNWRETFFTMTPFDRVKMPIWTVESITR